MDHHFGCTLCGACCQDLRVPLSRSEAMAWLERGDAVDVLCDAMPWFGEPRPDDAAGVYARDRSFAGVSGALAVRVTLRLVATFTGPCPNRQPDLRCRIYDQRPTVCRVYPADIFPFGVFDPATRNCTPDAWADTFPVLIRDGQCVDPATQALIVHARASAVADAALAAGLCAGLGITTAGLANEGYAVHAVAPEALLDVLRRPSVDSPTVGWTILSNRVRTLEALRTTGAVCASARCDSGYLGLFADEV